MSKGVVIFATADWNCPYWTNKQHTAKAFADIGYEVIYVESVGVRAPKLNRLDFKRIVQRLANCLKANTKKHNDNIWLVSPFVIPFFRQMNWVNKLNNFILELQIARVKKRVNWANFDLVWVYHPYLPKSYIESHKHCLVYHCVDDLSALDGVDKLYFQVKEENLLRNAKAVFVTSRCLEQKCKLLNQNTVFMPNVVDLRLFMTAHENLSEPLDMVNIPHPRVLYVGALSDFKVDFDLIKATLELDKRINWVFIGEEREGQKDLKLKELAKSQRVFLLGNKRAFELPSYMKWSDVGTLPTLINEYTASMFPMKYFEYLASGLPIVSTNLSFTEEFKAGVFIANNPQEFVDGLNYQISQNHFSRQESLRFVGDNTWDIRLKKMLNYLKKVT